MSYCWGDEISQVNAGSRNEAAVHFNTGAMYEAFPIVLVDVGNQPSEQVNFKTIYSLLRGTHTAHKPCLTTCTAMHRYLYT